MKKRSNFNQTDEEPYRIDDNLYKNYECLRKSSLYSDTVAFLHVEKNGASEKNDRSCSRGVNKNAREEANLKKQLPCPKSYSNDSSKDSSYNVSKEVFYKNNYIEIDEDPEINSEGKKQLNFVNNHDEVALLKSKIDEEYINVSNSKAYKTIKEEMLEKDMNNDKSLSENQELNNTKELLDNDIN